MSWQRAVVAADRTHHVLSGRPLYGERFDEVLAFHDPGLAPARRGNVAWHIRDDGTAAYPQRFRQTFGFYAGVATVESDDGWHHVRPDAADAYATRFAWCGNYQQDRCAVRDVDGLYLHIDIEGAAAYAARWRYVGDFREGLAVVQSDDGRSTHIDPTGHPAHDAWFRDLDVFHKGAARARDDRGWMHIARSGRPLYARRFAMVEPFYNGQARVELFDGALEVIEPSGQVVAGLRPATRPSERST